MGQEDLCLVRSSMRHVGYADVSLTSADLYINIILLQDVHNQLGNVRTFLFIEIFDPDKTLLNYPSFINTILEKTENKSDLLNMKDQRFGKEQQSGPSDCNLKIHPYHGGEFIGNVCIKLLNNNDHLQELVITKKIIPTVGFVRTFKHFNDVVQTSFGNTFHQDFEHHIKAFQESYF